MLLFRSQSEKRGDVLMAHLIVDDQIKMPNFLEFLMIPKMASWTTREAQAGGGILFKATDNEHQVSFKVEGNGYNKTVVVVSTDEVGIPFVITQLLEAYRQELKRWTSNTMDVKITVRRATELETILIPA